MLHVHSRQGQQQSCKSRQHSICDLQVPLCLAWLSTNIILQSAGNAAPEAFAVTLTSVWLTLHVILNQWLPASCTVCGKKGTGAVVMVITEPIMRMPDATQYL